METGPLEPLEARPALPLLRGSELFLHLEPGYRRCCQPAQFPLVTTGMDFFFFLMFKINI